MLNATPGKGESEMGRGLPALLQTHLTPNSADRAGVALGMTLLTSAEAERTKSHFNAHTSHTWQSTPDHPITWHSLHRHVKVLQEAHGKWNSQSREGQNKVVANKTLP